MTNTVFKWYNLLYKIEKGDFLKGKKTLGTALVLTAGVLWGLMGIFVNGMNNKGLAAMDVVAVRVWISAIVMTVALLILKPELMKIKLRDIWCFAGTGIVSLTMFNYFYFSNIVITSPGVAAVLMYTSPVFVMIMSAIFFKEKLTVLKIISCLGAFVGCALVSGIGGEEKISALGLVYGLLSGVGYALYSIFGRIATEKGYHSLTVSAYTFIFACLGTAPFTHFDKVGEAVFSSGMYGFLFAVSGAVIMTLVPYYVYTKGLTYIETGTAGVIAAIEVVVAALVGYFVFAESFGMAKLFGIAVVLSALAVMNIKNVID